MKKSTVRIGEAIYSILHKYKNVYAVIADNGTSFPFISYKRSSGFSQCDKDGIYSAQSTIDIMVAAEEYEESVDLADKVLNTMESTSGQVKGFNISRIRMIDSNESYIENAFVQEMKFNVEFTTI